MFVGGDGKEINRMTGGAKDADSFLARIKDAAKPENSWAYHKEQLKKNPDYAMTYVKILNKVYRSKEATEVFGEYFDSRSIEENFNAESMEYYNENVKTLSDKVFVYMLENQKAVSKVIGKTAYSEFIAGVVNDIISSKLSKVKSVEAMEKVLEPMKENKLLQTGYYNFLSKNAEAVVERSYEVLVPAAMKVYKKLDAYSLGNLAYNVSSFSMTKDRKFPEEVKDDLSLLVNYALDNGKFKGNIDRSLTFTSKILSGEVEVPTRK